MLACDTTSFASIPIIVLAGGGLLAFLVILSTAASMFAGKGSKDGGGRNITGCGGCFIGLGLMFCALIGAGGCIAVTLVGASSDAIRHGPVRTIEVLREPQVEPGTESHESVAGDADWTHKGGRAEYEWRYPVHLRVEVKGEFNGHELERWLREETDDEIACEVTTRETPMGRLTVLDFGLPIERSDLEELERELERELPWLELPEGVRIEFRGPDEGR